MTGKLINQGMVCPLCPYGCNLEVEIRRGFFARIRYSGPLCARGNAIPFILSSPKRLYSPFLQGREISWNEGLFEAVKLLKNFAAEKVAIGFDGSLTLKERTAVRNLAAVLGIKEVFQLNLENFTSYLVEGIKIASRSELENSEAIFVIGDLFSRFPLFARIILAAKYNKKAKIFGLDNYPNRVSDFADEFFLCPPGKEVSLLRKGEEKIFSLFAQAKTGVLILDAPPGKFFDPIGLDFASQLFLLKSGGDKYFLPVSQMGGWEGIKPAGEVLPRIKDGDISLFLFFGEELPIDFPKTEYSIYFTPWRSNAHNKNCLLFPTPHIVEKEGEILTFWGEVFKNGLSSYSGTKAIEEIISGLIKDLGSRAVVEGEKEKRDRQIVEKKEAEEVLSQELGEVSSEEVRGEGIFLLNDEKAMEFGGFFDRGERIELSPDDAHRIKVKEGEKIFLRRDSAEINLRVKVRDGLPIGYALVSLANPAVKKLFSVYIDRRMGEIIMRPTFADIWKEE